MQTLLLDRSKWDLVLDINGNIAVASDPYSISQDICSAVRTFLGEVWYDTTIGVPYFQDILGDAPNLEFIKSQVEAAALQVPQVLTAACVITAFEGRSLAGQVQFTYQPAVQGVVINESSTDPINSGIVSFIGDNNGVVTFIGSNTFPITFYGG